MPTASKSSSRGVSSIFCGSDLAHVAIRRRGDERRRYSAIVCYLLTLKAANSYARSMHQLRFPLLVLLLASGCATSRHVRLEPPPLEASAQERLAAYETLRPAAQHDTIALSGGQPVAQTTDFIILGDGRRVYHVEDLVPVVSPGSPTAEAVQRSKQARRRVFIWAGIGSTIAAAGAAMLIYGFTIPQAQPGDPDFMSGKTDIFVMGGLATLGVATAVFGIGGGLNMKEANDERVSAFALYDKDIRKRLDICVQGMQVVACDAKPTGASNARQHALPEPGSSE